MTVGRLTTIVSELNDTHVAESGKQAAIGMPGNELEVKGLKLLYVCSDEGIELFGTRGCSTHLRAMCQAFDAVGCQVKLVLANNEGMRDPSFAIDFEAVSAPKCRPIGYDLRKMLLNRRLYAKLSALLRDFRPDLIYERYDLYATAAARIAKRFQIPYVIEVNAPLLIEQRRVVHLPRVAKAYQRRTLSKADLLVGVSPEICSMLRNTVSGPRILLVENGVDETAFTPSISGENVRQRLGLSDKLVVGYKGSLRSWQGVSTLIDAASVLLQSRDDVRFLIAGGGNNLGRYEEQVRQLGLADKVMLIGPVPHNHAPEHIAAFDVCVAPYAPHRDFYFSPIKLREYIAMRKPIVASNVPQIGRLIRHGEDGLLAEPGDKHDFAEKIASLLDDPDLRGRLARSVYERHSGKMSWTRCAESVLEASSEFMRS